MTVPAPRPERCELSELLVAHCGCRIHKPAPRQPQHTGSISARYDGTCPCGSRFLAGDPIRMTGSGQWGHADCNE